MNDLTRIVVFTKVVEANSFTVAAQHLRISPSAVSRQVAELEKQLGIRLLNRTTRRLSLTDVGAEFYQRCAKGLASIGEARDIAARYRETPLGRLRVRAPQGFGRHYVAKLIPEFLDRYPEIQVDLSCGQLQKSVFEDGLDLMIQSIALSDQSLMMRDLVAVERFTCASPAYIRRFGIPREPRDLKNHNCIVFTDPFPINEWRYNSGKNEVAVRVSGNFESDNVDTLMEAMLRGVGIARLPNYMVSEALKSGDVQLIFSDVLDADERAAPSRTRMLAYYPKSSYPLPRVTVFLDYLEECLSRAAEEWFVPAPAAVLTTGAGENG